jgi:protein-disulfide isomerase
MSDLRSAPIPDVADCDHVRGADNAPLLVQYADLECPYCAVLHVRLADLVAGGRARLLFRHFPVRSAHPRAWASACATEAAAAQGRFWEMHDSIIADQGRLDDPHLWARAEALGLDLDRFEAERRGETVADRVQRDFRDGVRGGVVTTPTVFFEGEGYFGEPLRDLLARLSGGQGRGSAS